MKTNKKSLNGIGLDSKKCKQLSNKLNLLLANYQVMYMNTRGLHWNVKGEKFFELHLKFEELYNNFQIKIDEIAERVLTLGETPMHSYSEYLKHSDIQPVTNMSNGKSGVKLLLESFQSILLIQRAILDLSGEAGDEGTNALMSDYIREQEKLVWMLNAYLQ
ncbi:MAG: DNA starvation/stationary phase protection protein [Bacteroidetes bacterium]|nr:DNA starvation/stationary phase protection protein [Bacteroidota bacterium]